MPPEAAGAVAGSAARRDAPAGPPSHLLPVALVLWGLATELLAAALPLALLVLLAPRVPWRWELEPRDFDRVTDFTTVLFLGAAGYLFYEVGAHGVFAIARLLPLLLFPLLAAERFSTAGSVPLGALFFSLRRQRPDPLSEAHHRVRLGYPYVGVVLVASAATPAPPDWLYPALALVTGLALAGARPRYAPRWLWAAGVALAALIGLAAHQGVRGFQGLMEQAFLSWFESRLWNRSDPYRANTAIGQLGRLKLSDRVVLRVEGASGPLLLRQASYQRYRAGTWTALEDGFERLRTGREDGSWVLAPPPDDAGSAEVGIAAFTRRGRSLLALPRGSYLLRHVAAGGALGNRYGAVKVKDAPGFLFFHARFSPAIDRGAPPGPADLEVPRGLRPSLARIARELALRGVEAPRAVERLAAHFDRHFGYALTPAAGMDTRPPLLSFLETHRAGHCEYFASATVLLLRSAGIPARYAVGYSVQEEDPVTGGHLVRRRHAHSWAEVYHQGRWLDVDLTPSHWAEAEAAEAASWWLPAYDVVTRVWFAFNRWRWAPEEDGDGGGFSPLWLVPPLTLWLAWRLVRRRRVRAPPRAPERPPAAPGPPTPFEGLMPRLAARWSAPAPGETLGAWLERHLHADPALDPSLAGELRALLGAHYRQRYDPAAGGPEPDTRRRAHALLRRLPQV